MGRHIGIDLGTTNSVVAVDDGGIKALANADGDLYTRSAVGARPGVDGKTRLMFGREAVEWAQDHPADVVTAISRLIGRGFNDPEIRRLDQSEPYKIVPASEDGRDEIRVVLGGHEYAPIELASEFLKKLKADAEFRLGEEATHAVITVPAYFSVIQKNATLEAGRLAGLNVIGILDKPTAAAIAFGLDSSEAGNEAKTVLVYDLGGGSFDIAILVMGGGSFVTLNLEGDMWLGGDNFDEKLMELAVARCQEEYGIDPTINKRFMAQLKQSAREAKERLSSSRSTDISVVGCLKSDDGAIIDVEVEVTRNQFEELIRPLVERADAFACKALEDAKLSADEIDAVLMAGGSIAIPLVQQTIEERFGAEKLVRDIQPKLCVAFGAAIAASRIGCMVLQKEVERICQELGNKDGLQRSLGNQSLILQDWGRLDEKIEEEHVDVTESPAWRMIDFLESVLSEYRWAFPADQLYLIKKTEELRKALRSGISAEVEVKQNELAVLLNELPSRVSALIARSFSQEVPGSIDRVHFSVTAPPEVRLGDPFIVDIWAHLEKERNAVIERAQAGSPGERLLVKSKGPIRITRGTVLTVKLQLYGLVVEPAEETILWDGEIGNADFSVIVPKDKTPGPIRGLAQIYANGLRIVNINFIVIIGDRTQEVDRISSEVRRFKTAFASYASEDRDMVMTFIQGAEKMNPDMHIFVDVVSLRSGQLWEEELWKVIPEKDVFYLFWSRHAAASEWVEKEWRCGLDTRGITFIDPVPFVSPEIVPPPAELAQMHFNDWVLAYRRFENLRVSQ